MKLKTLFGKTAENLNEMSILFTVFGALPPWEYHAGGVHARVADQAF